MPILTYSTFSEKSETNLPLVCDEIGQTGNNMARPRDRAEVKTATINIRVTPTLKAKLEAHARIAGRKLSAECEERLLESMTDTEARASPDTEELLAEIKRLIGVIEEATGDKSIGHGWRKNVKTWAAVAEMLATGPIMQRIPPNLSESDKLLEQRYADLVAVDQEREHLAAMIALLGIVSVQLVPTLNMIAPNRDDLRSNARDRLPGHQQENAEALIAKLEESDTRKMQLLEEINEIVEPYRDAIERGRALYDRPRKGLALSAALALIDFPKRQQNALSWFPPPNAGALVNALLRPPSDAPAPQLVPPMIAPPLDEEPSG